MITNADQIISQADIATTIGKRINLNKNGNTLKACCPFHEEKTPSFTVTPAKNLYYCFGCHQGGNPASFIMAFDGVDFPQALEILSAENNIPIEYDKTQTNTGVKRNDIYDILSKATAQFAKDLNLKETEYLYKRGFTDKMIDKYKLGYAKGNSISKIGDEELLLKADILRKPKEHSKNQTPYNPFKGRIIIPLFDTIGRVIGFTGRLMENKENSAKYLNSHETQVFSKGNELYGYHFAQEYLRKDPNAQLYIMEGQLKTIANIEAGYPTVSAGGTGFTDRQATLVKNLSEKHEVIIAQDWDQAGIKSSINILCTLRKIGIIPKLAWLNKQGTECKDTDDLMAKKLPIQWNISDMLKWLLIVYDFKENSAQSANILENNIIPIIQEHPSIIVQNAEFKELEQLTGININILQTKKTLGTQNSYSATSPAVVANSQVSEQMTDGRVLIAYALQNPAKSFEILHFMLPEPLSLALRKAFRAIYYRISKENKIDMVTSINHIIKDNPAQYIYWLNYPLPKNINQKEIVSRIGGF